MGGQQPVVGSQVFLFAAGTAGYGGSSRSMLQGPGYATTGTGGTFSIDEDYTCQTGDQVYLLALGGNPGLTDPQASNSAIALAAALGDCSALSDSTVVNVNEVTTVAAAYALAGYLTGPTSLASSGSTLAMTGLTNAFGTAENLVNVSTGIANSKTASGLGTVSADKIRALADVIATCINSDGGSDSKCPDLFADTTPAGGSTPTDTFSALINLAHEPAMHVSDLFKIIPSSTVFPTTLSSAPNDWSLTIDYTDTHLNFSSQLTYPHIIADSQGRIWLQRQSGITVLSSTGSLVSPNGGYLSNVYEMGGLDLDGNDNAWYTSAATSTANLVGGEITASGTQLLSNLQTGSIGQASSVTVDSAGYIWFVKYGLSTTVLNSSGTLAGSTPSYSVPSTYNAYPEPSFATANGRVWMADKLVNFDGTIAATAASAYCAPIRSVVESALDRDGNLWGFDDNSAQIAKCNSSGQLPANFTTPLSTTYLVAVDGDNHIWSADPTVSTAHIVSLDNSGNILNSTYLQNDQSSSGNSQWITIDGSGNLWVAQTGSHLVEFVGVAAPVVTPNSAAAAMNKIGQRP